jgi:hypothetical protein
VELGELLAGAAVARLAEVGVTQASAAALSSVAA